jgi:hypothetical protein
MQTYRCTMYYSLGSIKLFTSMGVSRHILVSRYGQFNDKFYGTEEVLLSSSAQWLVFFLFL